MTVRHAPASRWSRTTTPVTLRLPTPGVLGVIASILLTASSYLAGATRNRGGVLEAVGIAFLSSGHGRNLGMVLFWAGMFTLVAAWLLAGKMWVMPEISSTSSRPTPGEVTSDGDASPQRFTLVSRAMWLWIIPLVVAAPLASRDVYSYLMQGAMVRDGFDPYSEGAAVNPGPYLLEVSYDWRNTTTPYGPLHLWMGEIVTRVVGDHVTLGIAAYKLISLLGFAAIAYAVPRIACELGGSPTLALWLGVANPVMILHLIGGMHNESVMVGLVSVGLLLCLRHRYTVGILLIGVAVSLKATAFIALPFVVWLMVHHFRGRVHPFVAFVASGAYMVMLTVAAVAAVTWASGSSWGWLSEITGNSKVINPLAGPTLITDTFTPLLSAINDSITYNQVLGHMRTLASILMLVGLVVVWWLFRKDTRTAVLGIPAAYQVAFIFNSVTLPWYYVSVICLLGVARPPRWLIQLSIGATVFIALAFSSDGNHQLYTWWWVLATLGLGWFASSWLVGRPEAKKLVPVPGE